MNIKLNEKELDLEFDTEVTIGDVLGNIEAACREKKNTITQVYADGKALTINELDELFQKPIQKDLNIELFTTSGNDVREFLKELGKEFIKDAEKIEGIHLQVQTGNSTDVLKVIEEFSLNLTKFYETAKLFDIADITEDFTFGEKTLREYQKEISSNLDAIINAIENTDTVEISDLAEYELAPLVKELGNGLLSIS